MKSFISIQIKSGDTALRFAMVARRRERQY